MSQVSLFRKWRSRAFSDLVGQEAVVKTLRNVLAGGSPARAYLFCGPRGTGKTSTARIFAKALCCERGPALEPCNECSTCREISQGNCLDVFEIDAASNTQVEKIRDFIVDKVHFAPARARYKVYIIDEVHKLSSSSFNALLKTLEEPPAHVVFVLATTHPHELLPTILSRCQRYDFRAFSLTEIQQHLARVASQEEFLLDEEAKLLLARAAQGSMRDALVLLEQAHHYSGGSIGTADVVQMLGLLPQETLGVWVEALRLGQPARLLAGVEEMHRGGQDFVRAVDLWVDHLRLLMLTKVGAHEAGLNELNEAYRNALQAQSEPLTLPQILAWLRAAVDLQVGIREGQPARIALELCLVQQCLPADARPAPAAPAPPGIPAALVEARREMQAAARPSAEKERPGPRSEPPSPEPKPKAAPATSRPDPKPEPPAPPPPHTERPTKAEPKPESPPPPAAERKPEPPARPRPAEKTPVEAPALAVTNSKEFWPHFLAQVRERDKRLQAVLVDARLREFGPSLVRVSLPASHAWHYEMMNKSIRLLEEVSSQLMQSKVRFEVILDGGQVSPPQEQEHESLVKKAHGLFGGRILDAPNDKAGE